MVNTEAVLVALPAPTDRIRLVGDEDKHATLLYFGETESLPEGAKAAMLEAAAKASKFVPPFTESIFDVSRLGSENPPALVAMLSNRILGKIRDVLKMDPRLAGYLANATQHLSFTPHVTLGYPDYQGEAKLRELIRDVRRVRFDRLALWWGDEQIEFNLGSLEDDEYTELSMSDVVDNILAHHGVKGMHWGVRKDRGHEGEQAKTKKIAKLDKEYDKSFTGVKGYVKVHNAVADKINPRLDSLNNNAKYKDKDLTAPENSSLHKQYIKDFRTELQKSIDEVMDDFGTNSSGTRRFQLEVVGEGMNTTWRGTLKDVEHADAKNNVLDGFVVVPHFDDNGFVTGLTFQPLDDALKHYGVKGMHWGVHRSREEIDSSSNARSRLGFRKLRPPATDDAKTAKDLKKRIKRGGVQSLSNKELQTLVDRMNLEQRYSKMRSQTSKTSKGGKWVSDFMSDVGKDVVSDLLKESTRRASKGGRKRRYHASQVTVNQLGKAIKELN